VICYHTSFCWYCDDELGDRHEHDHVQPRRVGGTFTVPACFDCHNLKDRVTLNNWPTDVALRAILDIGAEHELFVDARQAVLAVLDGESPAIMPIRPEQEVMDAIRVLPAGPPRVLMAKMYALVLDAARLSPSGADRVRARL
jgi:hypothetical protein